MKRKRTVTEISLFLAFLIIALGFFTRNNSEKTDDEFNYPLAVSFVDVGQGDGTLIECNGTVVVIDGGESENAYSFSEYLKSRNVEKIDCYIVSHPHSDHIGCVAAMLKKFEVKSFVMPYFSEMNMPTTKTYENMLNAVYEEDCEVCTPSPGDSLSYGELTFDFFAPVEETDNYNDMSLVFRMTYKNSSFLFAGDAEKKSENLMLENGADLKADVLKVGHHGSKTSSSAAFIEAVLPDYAVISCGADNEYGHPDSGTLFTLESHNIKTYRTDVDGTVRIYSDGNKIITES